MHPRLSRKKELARRTLVYALMTMSMIGLLIILMMVVLGYQFDINTRSVERTGLVQYNSFPRPATVSVDGRNIGRTQTKNNVLPGVRQFGVNLAGYEPWQKTLSIQAGTVTWLSYVRLVPTEKIIDSSLELPSIESVLTSPDNRHMALWRMDEGVPTMGLIDFRDSDSPLISEQAPTTEQISGLDEANLAESHKFTVTGWSGNSRYFITRHDYTMGDGTSHTEWLWSDRDSLASTVNLTTLLGLSPDEVKPMTSRDVFILINQDVRQASIGSGTISKPLIGSVRSFSVRDDDTITYISQTDSDDLAGVWRRSGATPVTIASYPRSESNNLRILSSRYFNKDTVAVSFGQQVTFYRGDIPTTEDGLATFLQTANSFMFNREVNRLQFSGNGRFLLAEDGKGFVSYDLERQEVSQNVRKYSEAKIGWIDSYHVAQIDESGEMILQEFDGLNANKLMPVSPGFDHLLTQDDKYMYGWYRTNELVELRRLMMTI